MMDTPRTGLLAGLLYGIPFALWVLGSMQPGPEPPDLSTVPLVLAYTQALVLVLLLPALTSTPGIKGRVVGIALLIMVPWPVLVPALGTGTIEPSELAAREALVALLALVLATARTLLPGRLPSALRLAGIAAIQASALLGILVLPTLLPVGVGDLLDGLGQ
jgi:hypothetical protein